MRFVQLAILIPPSPPGEHDSCTYQLMTDNLFSTLAGSWDYRYLNAGRLISVARSLTEDAIHYPIHQSGTFLIT